MTSNIFKRRSDPFCPPPLPHSDLHSNNELYSTLRCYVRTKHGLPGRNRYIGLGGGGGKTESILKGQHAMWELKRTDIFKTEIIGQRHLPL